MVGRNPDEATLDTLHADLTSGFAALGNETYTGSADLTGEMRTGFADLRSGIADLREELLLREGNRLHEERFTQLDLRMREQHLEIQQVLHAVVERQRALADEVRRLAVEATEPSEIRVAPRGYGQRAVPQRFGPIWRMPPLTCT